MSSSRPPAYITTPLLVLVAVVLASSLTALALRGPDALVGESASSRAGSGGPADARADQRPPLRPSDALLASASSPGARPSRGCPVSSTA